MKVRVCKSINFHWEPLSSATDWGWSKNYLARAILTWDKPDSARVSTLANFRGKRERWNFQNHSASGWLRRKRWRWILSRLHGQVFPVTSRGDDHFTKSFLGCLLFLLCESTCKTLLTLSLLWSLRFHFEIILIFYFISFFFLALHVLIQLSQNYFLLSLLQSERASQFGERLFTSCNRA